MQALRLALGAGGQRRSAFEHRGGGAVAASRVRCARGFFERCGDAFVGPSGRFGRMPCAPRRILRADGVGERCVDEAPLRGFCSVVADTRDKRVAKPDPGIDDVEQPGVLSGGERGRLDAERRARALDQRELSGRLRRGDGKRSSRRFGQRFDTALVGHTDRLRHGQRLRQRFLADSLPLVQGAGQLEQRQRVARRCSVQLEDDLLRQSRSLQQLDGLRALESADDELVDAGRLEHARIPVTSGKEHRQWIGFEPARDEDECIRGRRVEPMRIVDDAEQWLLLAGRGQKAERAGADEETAIQRWSEPERAAQRCRLSLRDLVDEVDDRAEELVKTGERQLGLGLHSLRMEHAHVACPFLRITQERALADARFTAHHERATGAGRRLSEQHIDALTLRCPADQHADDRIAVYSAQRRAGHSRDRGRDSPDAVVAR
jgi:hypothetical protein